MLGPRYNNQCVWIDSVPARYVAFVPISVLVLHSMVHAVSTLRSLPWVLGHITKRHGRDCWVYYIGFVNVVFGRGAGSLGSRAVVVAGFGTVCVSESQRWALAPKSGGPNIY